MADVDHEKIRREFGRWLLLLALNNASDQGIEESVLLEVLRARWHDATRNETRKQLTYLDERELVKLVKRPDNVWHAKLTRYGFDIVEYTVDCDPGIARPAKYA